ncbi:hypothetical protein BT93_L4559 [Corymbia citriodora subsp. variegata]|uniref:S-protein homolog n=1 Tax=Corymbia citriodora subsp. variegata TaxID=360336 RepID=A0A8T0CU03_CORYI|nr:hypothetical protein BT93_L4559 [Corymbia citriodora subsp. variegata]
MNLSIRLFVAFTIILTLLQACIGDVYLPAKTRVQIFNSLPGEVTLTVHCKSKDDDLGFHQIPPNGSWEFHFKANFVGSTLFFCSMQWSDQFHYFDIYIEKRDYDRCKYVCPWYVRPSGPCFNNTDCENWNS